MDSTLTALGLAPRATLVAVPATVGSGDDLAFQLSASAAASLKEAHDRYSTDLKSKVPLHSFNTCLRCVASNKFDILNACLHSRRA